MKERVKSTPYFAAYSLKATGISAKEIAATTHDKQFSRVINRLRVSVGTSYSKRTAINKINIPASVQSPDKNWFINYE